MFTVASKDTKSPAPSAFNVEEYLKNAAQSHLLAKNTTAAKVDTAPMDKKKAVAPQKKEESKPVDMRAQIQSIVASIQPALQKAIGSNNLAKIQVIITDKEEEKKKDE
jgi:hypothetical protein